MKIILQEIYMLIYLLIGLNGIVYILLQEFPDHGRNTTTVVGVHQNHLIVNGNTFPQNIQHRGDGFVQVFSQSIGNMLTVASGREIVNHGWQPFLSIPRQ